ncbi:MAG: hypothetical protein U0R19_37570 [Bryobacteraceae bacterium]
MPDTARLCNLLNVVRADGYYPIPKIAHRPKDFQSGPVAKLYTVTDPNSYSNLLFPATYTLDLEISAQNVKLLRRRVRIRLVGWHEETGSMFSEQGITIELLAD